MINLDVLKPYIVETNELYDSSAVFSIRMNGFAKWFDKAISMFLDCSKLSKEGHRTIQTNYIHYKYEMTTIVNMIEMYCDETTKDSYYQKLIEQHNKNLEFEAINGFEYKDLNTPKKSNKSTKKNRQKSIDFEDKPKRETAAERKLKAHAEKISKFTFKLNPVKK